MRQCSADLSGRRCFTRTRHARWPLGMSAIDDCDIFEVSTPEIDDVVRLEDRYGRVERT